MVDYNEFYDNLWGGISASLIDEDFITKNREFVETITFELYRIYEMDGNTSIAIIRRILVSILFHTFTFKINGR